MPTVVIVLGAEIKSPKYFGWLTSLFYRYYGVDTKEDHWAEHFRDYLQMHKGIEADVFHWSGGIGEKSLYAAAIQLIWFLETIPDTEVVLFTKSLGGNVVDIAMELGHLHVKKIIYVAVPHHTDSKKHKRTVPIINIYSKADNYLDLAIRMLYWGNGTKTLGEGETIVLDKLRHSDMNKNKDVYYKGKTWKLYDLYRELILG